MQASGQNVNEGPMHVVLVADHAYINGGQAKVAIESALGLAGRGHDVTFFAAVGPVDKRLSEAGIKIVCMEQDDISTASSQLAFLRQTMWNSQALEALRAVLGQLPRGESVVHVHAWAKALSPSIGKALKESGLPVVYTMHEFFLVCPNGGFYDYRLAEPCTRKPLSAACLSVNCDARTYPRKLLRVGRQILLDRFSGLKDAIGDLITISDLQYEVSAPYLPEHVRHHRVDNPVDVTDPGEPDRAGGTYLFAGRVSREKGIEHFCEGARLAGVRPVIAGDGDLADELRARYPEAEFLGWQSPENLRKLIRDARVLVFPSVWYEGQPLTVYEALALGTPVIVSDVCAGREGVRDGETGFWFHSADPQSLAQALRKMADDDVALDMARAAYRRYWDKPMTLERHVMAIEAVYRRAIGTVAPEAAEPASA